MAGHFGRLLRRIARARTREGRGLGKDVDSGTKEVVRLWSLWEGDFGLGDFGFGVGGGHDCRLRAIK